MSGSTDDMKGRIKQAAGDLTDNDDLHDEGTADRTGGKVKDAAEAAKDKVSDVVDAAKRKMDKQ